MLRLGLPQTQKGAKQRLLTDDSIANAIKPLEGFPYI